MSHISGHDIGIIFKLIFSPCTGLIHFSNFELYCRTPPEEETER